MNIKKVDINWNENLSIFASKEYLNSYAKESGWLGGFENNQLKYILPFSIFKKEIGSICLLKKIIFHTNIIKGDPNLETQPTQEKEFLNSVIQYLKQEKIDLVMQPPASALFDHVPDQSKFIKFASYIINLEEPEEKIWENMHSKHRNVIRKAEKEGVTISNDKKHLDLCYNMLTETQGRSQKSFVQQEKFKDMMKQLDKNIEIFTAWHDNKIQGCAIIPFSQYSAYYLYGGSSANPFSGSMNLLHWEAIKYFKNKNVKQYDFVGARLNPPPGSKLEGIQRFKSRFGGQMKEGYLWKMPINPFKSKCMNIVSLTKSLLRGQIYKGDIIDQELRTGF